MIDGEPTADQMCDPSEELMTKLTISQNRLQAYIFTLTADREAVQDILQATNLVIWRKAKGFVPGSNFIAWAFQIARYQVLAHRQKYARDRLVFSDELVNELAASMDRKPSDEYFQDKQAALAHCLEKVPSNRQKIIWLRYRDGLRIREIAKQINKTTSAVEQLIHRQRVALMRCISQRLEEEAGR